MFLYTLERPVLQICFRVVQRFKEGLCRSEFMMAEAEQSDG